MLLRLAQFDRESFFKEATVVDTGQLIGDRSSLNSTEHFCVTESYAQVSCDGGENGSGLITPLDRAGATMNHDQTRQT